MRCAMLVVAAAVVGIVAGCDGQATKYLQAAKEVEVEEAKLKSMVGEYQQLQDSIERNIQLFKTRGEALGLEQINKGSSLTPVKEQIEQLKNETMKLNEPIVEKSTDLQAKITAQQKTVDAARARRDALATK